MDGVRPQADQAPEDLIEGPLTRGEAAWVWVGLALAALPWVGLFAACSLLAALMPHKGGPQGQRR